MATASFKGVIEHLESFHGDTPMVMPLGIYLPQLNADDLFPRCAGADDYGVQAVVNLAQARIDELTEELAGVMERTLGGPLGSSGVQTWTVRLAARFS